MKKLSALTLLLVMALAWIAPRANAQEYDITMPKQYSDWHRIFSDTSLDGYYLQMAVINDRVYTLPAVNDGSQMYGTYFTRGYLFDKGTAETVFSGGSGSTYGKFYHGGSYYDAAQTSTTYNYAGPRIAADDAGTLWTSGIRGSGTPTDNSYIWAEWRSQMQYWTKDKLPGSEGGADRQGLDLGSYKLSGRADLMTAYGDCLGSTGGSLWFCINATKTIERINITKGAVTGKTQYTAPSALGNFNSRSTCDQYAANKVCLSPGVRNTTPTQGNTTKIYKGVINGSSITWTDLGVNAWSPCAKIAEFCGHEILVYASTATEFTVKDLTTGTILTQNTPWGTANASGSSWVQFDFDIVVDGTTAYIYVFTPAYGVARYSIVATEKENAKVENLKLNISENSTYIGRQDATLTWTCSSSTVSSFKIERRRTYVADATDAETTTSWVDLGTTTAKTFTETNVKWVSSDKHDFVPVKYEYRVTPLYSSGASGQSASASGTPEFIPATPKIEEIRNYEGYCKIQLFWSWNEYGCRPVAYDVYRDGQVATVDDEGNNVSIAAFDFVDKNLHADQTFQYKVKSLYPKVTIPEKYADRAWSNTVSADISFRDWSKPEYELEEVYNIPISDIASVTPSNFSNPTCYKQGYFFNDTWYIAQLSTNIGSSSDFSTVNNTNQDGGVIKFAAYSEADIKKGYVDHYKPSAHGDGSHHNVNCGVAVDAEGTVFIRGKNANWVANSTTSWYGNRNFEYKMTKGLIFTKSRKQYTVDFAAAGIDFGVGGQDYKNGSSTVYYSGVPQGRVDYFAMSGKLETDGYCYLYIAPSGTHVVWKIKLTLSGETVTPSIVSVNQPLYQSANYNQENYAYPVHCEGREDEFIYNMRSVAHLAFKADGKAGNNSSTFSNDVTVIDPGTTAADGAPKATGIGIVYNTTSRVNTAGGHTLEFNGELFVITPQGQFSINSGNFFVGMAERQRKADGTVQTAQEANILSIIPAAQWAQNDNTNSTYSDANGMWLHAEVPTIEHEMEKLGKSRSEIDADNNGECDYAYIYLYRPGYRFAKYKLKPSSTFPPTQIDLDIEPRYTTNEAGENIDLVRYDAVATWSQVENYGVDVVDGNQFYEIASYKMSITDCDGNVVAGPINIDVFDEDGVNSDVDGDGDNNDTDLLDELTGEVYTVGTTQYSLYKTRIDGLSYYKYVNSYGYDCISFVYVLQDVAAMDASGAPCLFTADVQVQYVGIETSVKGQARSSLVTEYSNQNGYEPVAPDGSVVISKSGPNRNDKIWADWDADGVRSDDDGYWDRYYINLDIEEPVSQEPVSYYTITVTDQNGDSKVVTDITIYNPATGNYEPAPDGKIPGDYPFEDVPEGTPIVKWTVDDYVGGTSTPDGSAHPADDGDVDPTEWVYTIGAHYAATNAKISKDADTSVNGEFDTTTDVEIVSAKSALVVFPVPATSTVTVKSADAINTIAIYSAAGVKVVDMDCEGENVVVVAIDNLAAGNYFIKVNNLKPVKIVKL
ncbi:MAG: T9SS type A sorting domain-containing protein [Muribaculaceae bacterium]|nr:T9SS type A sorting domain-containing protein [Muribaculaceae bacterium]